MMLLTTVSKIKKVWTVAFVPRLLRGDQRCTPVSYAVLRKANKSTNTSDDGEDDKKGRKKSTNYEYIFIARKEPTLEREKNSNDTVPGNAVEETISPIASPQVLTKETQVEKCQRLIEKAFGKHKKLVSNSEHYRVEADNGQKEVETANLKFEGECKTKETQVERCQRIIEKAFGRHKPKLHASGEPYYCTDVDIDQTRRELKEKANLKYDDRLVEKPVTDDRVHFGVYRKNRIEYSKEDTLIPPLEAQVAMNEAKSAKRGGTKEPATITDHYEDLNLMQQTLNIYLTPGNKGPEDNMDNTLQPEKPNLIRTDAKIDVESTLNATATAAPNAEPTHFSYYDGVDDTLPLKQSVLKEDIDKYVHKQELMEEKLFCDMKHMYENAQGQTDVRPIFKKSDPIGFEAQSVKHNPDTTPILNTALDPSQEPVINNIYSESYWLEDSEDPNEPYKADYVKEEKTAKNIYWNANTLRDTKTLHATTAKETEEQLTQKVEHIDETPLVEAYKPKIEGFNVTPRVLGDMAPSYNYFNDKRADNQQAGAVPRVDPSSYDEVAKRCLDTPMGKIDELLLKEMEKLGVPATGRRDSITPSPVVEDDLVQMDVRRSTEKKDLESQGYERVAEKLFEPRTTYPAQQTVKCNEEVQTNPNYEINLERKFVIHPNQVLIDPYDKKTIAQDTEEYDADNFYDPTQKFAYFYVPEKSKAAKSFLNKKKTSLTIPKVAPTEQKMHDDVDVNDSWDAYQYDPSSELPETHRVYAKWIDNTPSSEAAKMTTNNIWDEEQSNPSDNKYAHNFTSTTIDKITPFTQTKTCGTHNMWHEQYFNPQLQNYVHQNLIKKPDVSTNRTPTPQAQQHTHENSHYNYYNKNSCEGYTNNMGTSPAHFFVPASSWDRSMQARHNMEPVNRTNINVSDGIWDEQLLEERFVKPEKKCLKLNKKWNQDHLQSDSPLAYSAHHYNPSPRPQGNIQTERPNYRDVTPRPQVRVCDTSHVPVTDFQYEHDHSEVYPDIHLNIPQEEEEKSYDEKMKKIATFLQAEAIWESTRMNTAAMNSANFHAATMPAPSIPDTLNALPKLNEAVSLTELLRRVRERSRIIECKNELKALGVEIDPLEGKCGGTKKTNCSPMAPRAPPRNPPPNFGLPQIKQRPPMCKPKRKPRTNKCTSCEMDMSLGLRLGPQIAQAPIVCPEMVCEMNLAGAMEISLSRSRADLTDDIIDRLQALGKVLGVVLRQGKTEVLESAVVRHRRGPKVVLARNYEPWSPIPSWPMPKKTKRKEPPCEPGCKIFPPTRATFDPPCNPQTCQGFPKKTFAVLDCFAVSLGENKVYDLGEF